MGGLGRLPQGVMATDNAQPAARRIFLLSCVKKKKPFRTRAGDLYDSALFRKMLRYAQRRNPDEIFILSAKHGLLSLDDIVDPYEQTLKTMPAPLIRFWAARVLQQLQERADLKRDRFTILASEKYRRHLLPHLQHYCIPMKGLSIGRQLQFLNREINR